MNCIVVSCEERPKDWEVLLMVLDLAETEAWDFFMPDPMLI